MTTRVKATPAEIIAFYKKQAEDSGFTVSLEGDNAQMKLLGGESPNLESFTLTVSPMTAEGDMQTAQLNYIKFKQQ